MTFASAMKRRLLRLAERWKPAAGLRSHLFAASFLWTAVGTGLTAAGLHWCAGSPPPRAALLAAAGVAAGVTKGRFVIRGMAVRNAARIVAKGDGRCLGGFLSWQTWLLVLLMMGSGAALRRSVVPRFVLGFIYTAAGTALLAGALTMWREYRRAGRRPEA